LPEAAVGLSLGDAIRCAADRLEDAGCQTPRLDAEVLLAFVLGVGRAALVMRSREQLPEAASTSFDSLVERRAAREPVAYITGVREFRWISLAVDRRVLIPRPETELLVEVGLSLPHAARVVDVGTGSGAVALALKHERPDLRVSAVDIDPGAVEVAGCNARRLGLDVKVVLGDLLPPGRWDAVLANLPYVAEDSSGLPPEIALYEPSLALFAGRDGLDVVRRLLSSLDDVPFVALEVGYDQAAPIATFLRRTGFRRIERRRDLGGHERVVVGWR
jgi:release factor glutamine methyltransferase